MSKYSNWGNYKSKTIKFNDREIKNKEKDVDLSPFNQFNNSSISEMVELNDDTSIMLMSSNEEVGYAILKTDGSNTSLLEVMTVNNQDELEDMINRRDIAIGTIVSAQEPISSPEQLLHEENNFLHDAENTPHYISNEALPQGCEIMMVYDQSTNSYSASIIKNGYVVDTVNSEDVNSQEEFCQSVAQSAIESSAKDPRIDNDNIKAVQAVIADAYLIEMIKEEYEKMKYIYESHQEYLEDQREYYEALDKVDGDESYVAGKGFPKKDCPDKCPDCAIEIDDENDLKFNKPAQTHRSNEESFTINQGKDLETEAEEDEGLVLSRPGHQ